jgi:predicted ABC-type ATPase
LGDVASPQAFLAVEATLAQRIEAQWMREVARPLVAEIREAVEEDFFGAAYRAAERVHFDTVREMRPFILTQALSAFAIGQGFFAGSIADTEVARTGNEPIEIPLAVDQYMLGLQAGSAAELRTKLVALVAEAEEEAAAPRVTKAVLRKAVIPGFAAKLNRAVAQGSSVSIGAGANLTVNRLAAYGALTQAQSLGQGTFQVNEVMDSKTCPVCRGMHGMVFSVGPALQIYQDALTTQDPAQLKQGFPFPKQSKGGIARLSAMSPAEMQGENITGPPFHPHCRGFASPVGSVPPAQIQGFTAPADVLPDPVPRGPSAALEPVTVRPAELPETHPVPTRTPKTSSEKWQGSDGNWLPERQALHREIVEEFTSPAVAKEKKKLQMVGGGPASGKGTAIGSGRVNLLDDAVAVDADEIKARLPEFIQGSAAKDANAAAFVHAESSALSEQIMARSAADGLDVILDGTGDGGIEKLARRVDRFRDQGYGVSADYMTLPTDEAVARSAARFLETGRNVPEEVIREIHAGVSRDFKMAIERNLFDDARVWDTDVPRGDPPILIFEYKAGVSTVVDEQRWVQFLAKADE